MKNLGFGGSEDEEEDHNNFQTEAQKNLEMLLLDNKNQGELQSKFEKLTMKLESDTEANLLIKSIVDLHNPKNDKGLQKMFKTDFEIMDPKKGDLKKVYGKTRANLQKIINWFAYFQKGHQLFNLIKYFNLSPFINSTIGRSVIHTLCIENLYDLMKLLLSSKYSYFKSKREFDMSKVLNTPSGFNINTPAHHACIFRNSNCLKLLVVNKVPLNRTNFRGWSALQLAG